MRQVPRYLLIGNGRVARHFQHYFSLLNIPFDTWHRNLPLTQLHQQLNDISHLLILIKDDAIEKFIAEQLSNTSATCIHFSGSLVSDHAYGAHPLMSFNENLYTLDQYQAIPFVLDHDAPPWLNLMPGIPNQHVRLQKALKPKYHALCVLSGNFSCMLWQKLFVSFERELNIPASVAHAFLLKQTQNLVAHPKTALTGPLVRNDTLTVEKNLAALNSDPFKAVYASFIACYQELQKEFST